MEKLEFINLKACDEAADWASGKTWQEVYSSCHRGDWLLWLFARTNPDNLRELTLAKGHCANTVRHLMQDEISIAAVDAAIAFGEGKITKEKLAAAFSAAALSAAAFASAAYAAEAATDADADAAEAAADATAAASYAATAAAAAAATYTASYAASYAAATAAAAKKENQKKTADICRKYLPIEMWNV